MTRFQHRKNRASLSSRVLDVERGAIEKNIGKTRPANSSENRNNLTKRCPQNCLSTAAGLLMPDKISGVLTRRKITFGCNHVAANVADTIATATSSTPLRDRNRVEHSDTPPFYSPTTISHLHQHLVAPSRCLTLLFQAPNNPIIYFIGPVPINRLGLASTSSSSAT